MSLYPAGGGFTIDGVSSDTWHMFIRNPQHQHQPTARLDPIDIPGRTGRFPQQMELSSRLLSLDLGIYNTTRATMMQNIIDFSAATDPRNGLHKLVLTDDFPGWWIGLMPSSLGSGQTDLTFTQSPAPNAYATFTALYEAPDPHWYKTTGQSIPWTVPSGVSTKTKTITNVGNDSTPSVITIAYPAGGALPLTGIKIAFASTYYSSSFTYNGSMVSGDTVTIDMDAITILKNGVNDINNWGGDDFPLIPGTTTGLPQFTPPLTSPVSTVLTWTDTNNVGASVTIAYTERSI